MEENNNRINILNCIKSKYILRIIFDNLIDIKSLSIIRFNKSLQNKLDIDINTYIEMCKIKINIYPIREFERKLINIIETNRPYYHIYFDDNKEEIQSLSITKKDNVEKIKLIIDGKISNLIGLFSECDYIREVDIIKFKNYKIENISKIFYNCINLEKINFFDINTSHITHMSGIFHACKKLKEIDMSKFKTDNVSDKSFLFSSCESLSKVDISNFNTSKVTNMNSMFNFCKKLDELNNLILILKM